MSTPMRNDTRTQYLFSPATISEALQIMRQYPSVAIWAGGTAELILPHANARPRSSRYTVFVNCGK